MTEARTSTDWGPLATPTHPDAAGPGQDTGGFDGTPGGGFREQGIVRRVR